MDKEQLYLEIIDSLHDGIYFVDTERRITFWNKTAEIITGYKKEEVIGLFCQNNLLNHIDKDGRPLCLFGCPLYASITDGKQREAEVFLRHKEGHRIPILVNIFPIVEDGNIIGAVEIFTPESTIVYNDELIERLSNFAMSDQLTGLANRRKIESYLDYRLQEIKRYRNKFCVVFMDIDNFDDFNNLYGHEKGDEMLKSISNSIVHVTRKDDLFGRWGGEAFVGAFELKHDNEANFIAEKIRILITKSDIFYEGKNLNVTASFGVTIVREDDTVESVINRADFLMCQCKQKNKNCITSDI